MNEEIFWVWNGWGVLFTFILILWQFLHIFVVVKIGPVSSIRTFLSLVAGAALVATFVFSGWIAGLLALPIGMTGGVILAKLLVPTPS